LPDNVRLVRSWPRPLLQMQGIDDPSVYACAFVGYHAGPTAAGGILAHSYSGAAYRWLRLNGELCSEGYLNAALAGEFGKPVMFVSGDQQTVEDARRYAPEAIGFVSKQALGWRAQVSLPPTQVRRLLQEAMLAALNRPLPAPFTVRGPYRLELEMTTHVAAEMLAYLPGVERNGAYGVRVNFDRIAIAMQFVSFAMHYSPTGVIAI
jgi:D-amino peptidase